LVIGGEAIVRAYTSDAQVAAFGLSLLAILPFFHVADSAQTLTVYLLRAYKIALAPMMVQILALGGIGLAGGWFVAFGPGKGTLAPLLDWLAPGAPGGASSLWTMATIGMAVSLVLLQPLYWYVSGARTRE